MGADEPGTARRHTAGVAPGDGGAAGPRRPAAGHRLHLLPCRVRRCAGAMCARASTCSTTSSGSRHSKSPTATWRSCHRWTRRCSAPTSGGWVSGAGSPPTTRVCCRLSGTRWRNCLCADWSAGVRHRDTGTGHQYAGAFGGARALGQVQRRGARRPHPGEFTQLTGRAGRRGIDTEGHAVVVWTPQMQVAEVAGLAGRGRSRCAAVHARVQHGGQSDRPARS